MKDIPTMTLHSYSIICLLMSGSMTPAYQCWKHPSPFSNVHFRNTTKIAAQVLALNFCCFALLLSFSLNYDCILYFWFCSFFHLYGSFNHANSTSLSFSEFSELFTSTLLLSQHIESHFALSSARCHF